FWMGLRVVMPLGMAIVKVPPWLAEPLVVPPLDPLDPLLHAVMVMPASTATAASPVAFRLRDMVGSPSGCSGDVSRGGDQWSGRTCISYRPCCGYEGAGWPDQRSVT